MVFTRLLSLQKEVIRLGIQNANLKTLNYKIY
jgi:hypothetical protein